MNGWLREMPELELALLRRSVVAIAAGCEALVVVLLLTEALLPEGR